MTTPRLPDEWLEDIYESGVADDGEVREMIDEIRALRAALASSTPGPRDEDLALAPVATAAMIEERAREEGRKAGIEEEREQAARCVEAKLAAMRAVGGGEWVRIAPGVERALEEAAIAVRAGRLLTPLAAPAPVPSSGTPACPECGDSGWWSGDGTKVRPCPFCSTGYQINQQQFMPCPECAGDPHLDDGSGMLCAACQGSGRVARASAPAPVSSETRTAPTAPRMCIDPDCRRPLPIDWDSKWCVWCGGWAPDLCCRFCEHPHRAGEKCEIGKCQCLGPDAAPSPRPQGDPDHERKP